MIKDQKLLHELFNATKGLFHLKHFLAFESLSSTNDLALNLASDGQESGTIIMASRQLNGRGRLERHWHSGEADIIMSVILRPIHLPKDWWLLPFLPAVAILRALRSLGLEVKLKWPNDVIYLEIDGVKKLGGILIENIFSNNCLDASIIGIGINIEKRPLLSLEVPHAGFINTYLPVKREQVLKSLLRELDKLLCEDMSDLLKEYEANCATIGRLVKVSTKDGVFHARAVGLSTQGALVVNDGIKDHLILAGDINFSLDY